MSANRPSSTPRSGLLARRMCGIAPFQATVSASPTPSLPESASRQKFLAESPLAPMPDHHIRRASWAHRSTMDCLFLATASPLAFLTVRRRARTTQPG
ncbi:hypothetical protein K458DRAFT_411833 [Lentithecium fluviatile CBS 122367]|uniref:Uncharacterized protein n=1 Tax=Lentithecium fluviatile CBS 122367 TaxID=1168545 RepID=A0A6G1JNN4_9PLEO|nr:hypothetical protein K458DRAFT_411833 [Lentithecium fluviatile CBS 122367]